MYSVQIHTCWVSTNTHILGFVLCETFASDSPKNICQREWWISVGQLHTHIQKRLILGKRASFQKICASLTRIAHITRILVYIHTKPTPSNDLPYNQYISRARTIKCCPSIIVLFVSVCYVCVVSPFYSNR